VVRVHVLSTSDFRSNYLWTKCQNFHQTNVIRCKMVVGFPKSAYNRKLGKNRHNCVVFKYVVEKISSHFDHSTSHYYSTCVRSLDYFWTVPSLMDHLYLLMVVLDHGLRVPLVFSHGFS
jgi:hypothetical protein